MDTNTGTYDPTGSYLAYAALAVGILGRFGWTITVQDATLIISAIGLIVGTIMSHRSQKQLAITTGSIRK